MKFLTEDGLPGKLNFQNLLSVNELAEKLNVPISWVYGKTRTGSIPMVRVGKYVRFQFDEVLEWLKHQNESN